ncbi:hypothetical protein LOK55_08535 [Microbacterium sp. F2E]|uniref:hypothetical protein n=1 Tax=Microbacterium sp. F2E TaxID=2895284 RepID=UPI001E493AF8|nr:hypothetical protein [Microbacterium sp. F2E]MCC9054334.1 hypothetical protein [Microbacterium sp. F2E]
MTGVRVTTELDEIDLDVVHRWLSEEAYWALGRSRDLVERAALPDPDRMMVLGG